MANPAENNVKNESPAQENKMGVMPVGKLLFTMSLPIMISMLVQALYNVVDSMFVARVSENALTALSMAFPIQNLMIAVSTGLGVQRHHAAVHLRPCLHARRRDDRSPVL